MAFGHGSKAVVKIADATDVLTDISQWVSSASFSGAADTAETTTLGSTAKRYLPGLRDATLSLEGRYDPTVDAILEAAVGVERDFEYGPQGGASGSVKYTGRASCTSYEISTPVDDVGSWSAEFQVSEGWTRGTYA